eukprot:jgi/Ulvmu1/11160/UM071_0044.1
MRTAACRPQHADRSMARWRCGVPGSTRFQHSLSLLLSQPWNGSRNESWNGRQSTSTTYRPRSGLAAKPHTGVHAVPAEQTSVVVHHDDLEQGMSSALPNRFFSFPEGSVNSWLMWRLLDLPLPMAYM